VNYVRVEKRDLQNSNTSYVVESQILPVSTAAVCFLKLRWRLLRMCAAWCSRINSTFTEGPG